MTQFVTRCPKCSTSFRINQAQLDRAKGAVRCGSCLQIFRAKDHLVNAKPTAASAKPGAASAKPKPAKPAPAKVAIKPAAKPAVAKSKIASQADAAGPATHSKLKFSQQAIDDEADWDDSKLIHDDLDQEKKKDDIELTDSFFDDYTPRQKNLERSLFDREINTTVDDDDDESADTDESWAVNMLDEIEKDPVEQVKIRKGPDGGYTRASTGAYKALQDSDIKAAHKAKAASADKGKHQQAEPAPRTPAKKPAAKPTFSFDDSDDDRHDPMFTDMEEVGDRGRAPSLRAYDPEHHAMLSSIEPEPLELGFHVETSNWPRRLLWSSLALVCALALVAQLGTYNIETWARQPNLRNYYAQLCPLLGCTLPSVTDPRQVKVSNLVIRSHPRMSNALLIDTVLLNRAPFAQPFPPLEIQFSDLNGTLVAQRRFMPREYLGGEMAGQANMPSNQPVHIAIEIMDPGEQAVNYSATIPL